ncbi:MAG: tetratricopeptide repeat protein, partial [Pirellulales bacterium]|nr:tetratricopeptide repeat protein [Pirellulales bacterium]
MKSVSPLLVIALAVLMGGGCGRDPAANNTQALLRQQQRNALAQSEPQTFAEQLAKAERRIDNGNLDLAESLLRKLLITHPDDARVMMLAARCQVAQGDPLAAAQTVDSISDQDVEYLVDALHQAADWLIDAGYLDQAQLRLQRVLQLEGESNRVLHRLAQLLNNQGRRIEARTYLRALARSGDATEKELYAMNCFAEPFIDTTLAVPEPSQTLTIRMLGQAKQQWGEGEVGRALVLTRRLADAFPQSRQIAAFEGRLLAELQDETQLLQWARNLPDGISREPEYWGAIASWLQRRGHHSEAVRCFGEAVLIDDTDRFSYLGLAQSLRACGDDRRADLATERFKLLNESAQIARAIGAAPGTRAQLQRMAELMDLLRRPWE